MELTIKNIEEYIDRFMEGETSNEEEQAIYHFFHTEEIPEHLKPYAPMFAWYEEGMPEKEGGQRSLEKTEAPKIEKQSYWKRMMPTMWGMGIAAMLVIGIGLGVIAFFDEDQTEEWSCYEGSYVEVNGKRISDVKAIMPSIQKTLAEAEQIEKQIEERLEAVRKSEEAIMEKEKMLANY
ncbi:MAG: hypothetical protein IJY59_04170 [Bacteroidaceae bacterium]|nr:hypothetical protein [Bacteroidaceae bacterium]